MDFNEWFEQLLLLADDMPNVQRLIAQAPFMYEDYFDNGMTPDEAMLAEWGM